MHAQGARDLQMGAGDNGKRLTTCVEVAIPIGMASFCCRCSEKAFMASGWQAPSTNALCSSPNSRDYQSAMGMHGEACESGAPTWSLRGARGLKRRH